VDIIFENTNKNKAVYEFISNYLVHGFKVLKMESLVQYIEENN